MILDIDTYVQWWEDAAAESLGHVPGKAERFHALSIEEIFGSKPTMDWSGPVLVVDYPEIMNATPNDSQINRKALCGVTILYELEVGDPAALRAAVQNSYASLEALELKVRQERESYHQNPTQRKWVSFYRPGSTSWSKVGPLWGNCHGYRMEFEWTV